MSAASNACTWMRRLAVAGSTALIFAACGGGMDGTGSVPPPGGLAITSSGVMASGSVVLNGRRFDSDRAAVVDDRGRPAAALADGMVVRLRGNLDNGVGRADLVAVENELRARIASVDAGANPQRFVAGGVTVLLDAATVFSGGSPASLAVGVRVEVHGLRDGAGQLRASRIELIEAAQGLDELRAAVGNLDLAAQQFALNGSVVVRFAGATFRPLGARATDLANGALVEVRGALAGSEFTAVEVAIKALEDRARAARSRTSRATSPASPATPARSASAAARCRRPHRPSSKAAPPQTSRTTSASRRAARSMRRASSCCPRSNSRRSGCGCRDARAPWTRYSERWWCSTSRYG